MYGEQLGEFVVNKALHVRGNINKQTFENQARFWRRLYQVVWVTRLHLKYAVWTLLKDYMFYYIREIHGKMIIKTIHHKSECAVQGTSW